MRKLSFSVVAVFFLLAFVGASVGQDFKQVHPGVEYVQVQHKIGSDPVKINLLRLDLKKVRLDVHHALDRAIGLETTSSIAKRKGAVAAINAGFFRLDKSAWAGDAAGILVIDKKVLSENSNGRIALSLSNEKRQTSAFINTVRVTARAGFGVDSGFRFDGINRERKANEIILFTPEFNGSTLTDGSGTEVVLSKCRPRPYTPRCEKASIQSVGNSQIPADGFVISIGKDSLARSANVVNFARKSDNPNVAVEDLISIQFDLFAVDKDLSIEAEDITNGVPRLVRNRKIDITWEQEKASKAFAETRHPRTAVAKLKDGKFLMVTVDGRQPGVSVGMSLQELAEYLLSLGAVDAMNLDGGGSTTMFLDGKVVNTPSDKEGERKIGDAIVVSLRKK